MTKTLNPPHYQVIGLLHGLFGMLGQKGDLGEILSTFLSELGEYLDALGGVLLDASQQPLASYGPPLRETPSYLEELTREVYTHQRPMLLDENPSIVGVPLVNDHRLIGAMVFYRTKAFIPEEIPFLGVVALPLAIHLENLEYAQTNAARRAELEAVLASMVDGLVVVDREGRIQSFNQAFKDMTQIPADEIFLRSWADFFHPLPEQTSETFEESLKTGKRFTQKRNTVLTRPDGTNMNVAVSLNTVVTQASHITGGVIGVRDITREVQIDRLKDEFISTVSHELRTPLTIIRGFIEMLTDREMSREENLQLLDVMGHETHRLERLINDLLDLSKIQSNRMTLSYKEFKMERLLRQCIHPFEVRHHSHRFNLSVSPAAGRIIADPDRITQVIINLVGNAVKYSQGGTVSVKADREGGRWVISVEDQGMGIPAQHLGHIFDRFYRVNENQTEGSGLGLFITKTIVERHQGKISVKSRPGVGTIFTIDIPATPPQKRP